MLCRALDAAERAVAAGETRTETLLELVRQEIGNHRRSPAETPMSVRSLDLARASVSSWRRLAREIIASVNEIVAEAERNPPQAPDGT